MTPTFLKKWMNSSNLTDSEKADLSAYSTDEPDSSTAIEEVAWFKFFWKVHRGRFIRLGSREFAREEGGFSDPISFWTDRTLFLISICTSVGQDETFFFLLNCLTCLWRMLLTFPWAVTPCINLTHRSSNHRSNPIPQLRLQQRFNTINTCTRDSAPPTPQWIEWVASKH